MKIKALIEKYRLSDDEYNDILDQFIQSIAEMFDMPIAFSAMGEATAKRGGRAKKFFEITAEGKQALQETRQSLDAMWRDVKLTFVGVK